MSFGIDIVDVERFRRLLGRAPLFPRRFFTSSELEYCARAPDPALRLAGTLAAKEAVMKASGLTPAAAWARRVEIIRDPSGRPAAVVGTHSIPISISHDGGFAVAIAARYLSWSSEANTTMLSK